SKAYLFSPLHVVLPAWFQTHWGEAVRHMQSKLLPAALGLAEQSTTEGYPLTTATPERATLELWTCNGFAPVTYLIMPPWLQTRVG
ncbi:type IV toxin-antitoxin system AbiEi family antitoxin domain-containing protein, partial [Sphingomonas koreensis]|uniref:type IV toxin-antitoxin system AbiEi family antitoxin domain-containing protein n=1 Tax=Sphingomonas koreensis TaxID=93064 RepID=UPI001F49F6B9